MIEAERRFRPLLSQEHRFPLPEVTEFKEAIYAVGGRIIEDRGDSSHNPEETEYYRVIDTAARLSAVLFGNTYFDTMAMRSLFIDPDTDIHPIDIINGRTERKKMSNFLNSVMHVVPIYLINDDTPLTPSGLIALSALSKLPTNPELREEIRRKAKQLLKKDPTASRVYKSDSGRFNGQFDFVPTSTSIEHLMGATR